MKQLFFLSLATLALSTEAYPSSDNCILHERIYFSRPDLTPCYSDLPYLQPFNDSVGNFTLLTNYYLSTQCRDPETPATVEYESELKRIFGDEEGQKLIASIKRSPADAPDPCQSNNARSALEFLRSLPVIDSEAKTLISARTALLNICGKTMNSDQILQQLETIPAASDRFDSRRYLEAALRFYQSDYKQAEELFATLSTAADPWIREASLYLAPRAAMILAQQKWDGYDWSIDLNQVDRAAAERADYGFQVYLMQYPRGVYSQSAYGLLRRTAVLLADKERIRSRFTADFEEALQTKEGLWSIEREFERFLPYLKEPVPFDVPLIAATAVLVRNRQAGQLSESSLDALEQNKRRYDRYPGLYELLRGEILFSLKRYDEAIALRPAVSDQRSMIGISRLIRVALAEEEAGRPDDAFRTWKVVQQLHQGEAHEQTAQHGNLDKRLAAALLRNRLIARDFFSIYRSEQYPTWMTDSVIETIFPEPLLREIVADEKATASSRRAAANTLLLDLLFGERWSELVSVHKNVPESVRDRWQTIATAADHLLQRKREGEAWLKIGLFVSQQVDTLYQHVDSQYLHIDLFGVPDSILRPFIGTQGFRSDIASRKTVSPLIYYSRAIEKLPRNDPLRAEALHHAIRCFGPRWEDQQCIRNSDSFDRDFPETIRHRWFRELKRDFKDTSWAKAIKYYW